jgi:hypothetical protein
VKAAADAIVVEEPTGGNDLGLDGEVAGPGHLAEIRRSPGTHQGFEPTLPLGTHDFDLQVTATGSSPGIVGGPAGCQGTGVRAAQHREAPPGRVQGPYRRTTVLHDEETVPIETARLLRLVRSPGSGSLESVGDALCGRATSPEIPTWDVQHRLDVELAPVFPDLGKGDVLGMAEKPGGLMVQGGVSLLERADPKGHGQAPALGTQLAAWRHGEAGGGAGLNGDSHVHPEREKPTADLN